jgi:hypothetical protein
MEGLFFPLCEFVTPAPAPLPFTSSLSGRLNKNIIKMIMSSHRQRQNSLTDNYSLDWRRNLSPVSFRLYKRIAPPYPLTMITITGRNQKGHFCMDSLNDSPVDSIFKI